MDDLKEMVRKLPDAPGVYLFKDAAGRILYVGKAVSLRKRVASYLGATAQRTPKTRVLMSQVIGVETVLTGNEREALLLENNLIKRHRPRYNVLLRDDKTYPYLKITASEKYPRILLERRPRQDGSLYYGPYPHVGVTPLLKIIRRFFGICDCKEPRDGTARRACLRYQLHQCPGPCIGAVTPDDYAKHVEKLRWFLEGKHDPLGRHVREEMERASEAREYEEAARLRDLSDSIAALQKTSVVVTAEPRDTDAVALASVPGTVKVALLQMRQGKVIGRLQFSMDNAPDEAIHEAAARFLEQHYVPGLFLPEEILVPHSTNPSKEWMLLARDARKGPIRVRTRLTGWRKRLMEMAEANVLESVKEELERARVLRELGKALRLPGAPRTIACFDVSTLQGVHTVGSAVLFRDGLPVREGYRKFRIEAPPAGKEGHRGDRVLDDYASLAQMVGRYLALLDREGEAMPDLFLIDGGKGQLSAVEPILRERGGRVAALAKRMEEVFTPGRKSPLDLSRWPKTRHLLMRVRDEAHRFAVAYHRNIRGRDLLLSSLRGIQGLGKVRTGELLRRFGSLEGVRKAPLDELQRVPGLGKGLAERILKTLQSKEGRSKGTGDVRS